MDESNSSANPAHPPPARTETRTCASCGGEGYVPLDQRYDWTTDLLTIIGGPCSCCLGTGEQVVYLYRGGGA